jgi:competence protein ComEA
VARQPPNRPSAGAQSGGSPPPPDAPGTAPLPPGTPGAAPAGVRQGDRLSQPGAWDQPAEARAVIAVHDPRLAASHTGAPDVPPAPGATPAREAGLPPEWSRLRLWAGGLLLVTCFALFGWLIWRGREPAPMTTRPPDTGSAAEIKVQLAGAVATPGVYRLLLGDRLEDAVRAAGGFAPDADTSRVNLAQRVRDEQRIEIPFLPRPPTPPAAVSPAGTGDPPASEPGPPPTGAAAPTEPLPSATARPAPAARPSATALPERSQPATSPASPPGGRVNVNTASAAQLERLPGIGEVSARRIIEYRQRYGRLTSLDDLRKAGLSESIIRRAADYLAFD